MNYFYLLLSPYLLVKITQCSTMTFKVYPDENIYLNNQQYAINIDDSKQDEIDINKYNIEILKEIRIENEKQMELNGNEKLFSFNSFDDNNNNNNNNIDIVLLKNNSIECLYEIKNYIQDDKIIMKQKDCQILLNQQDCIKLYKLDQFIYIIQCNYNSTNTIIQILNSTQILDQLIIPIQSNCQSDSIFNNNNQTLIIFNKLCQTTLFYTLSIINLSFYNLIQYDLKEIEGFSEITQQLMDIQFYNPGEIQLVYIDCILVFVIKIKYIALLHKKSGMAIKKFFYPYGQRKSILIEDNVQTQQLIMNNENLNISSAGFQNVFQIKKNLYLFQFTNKILVKLKNFHSNKISMNTKHLIKIGELPFFMALSNQQLKLIQIILPKSVVSYTNSDKLLIMQTESTQIPNFVINLQLLDQNNPIQYFNKTELYHQIINPKQNNQLICLSYKTYQRTLPIKINQIMDKDTKLKIVEDSRAQILSNLNEIQNSSTVLLLHKFNDDQLLIGIQEGNRVIKLIFYQNNQAKKVYKFSLHANLIDVFFNRQEIIITIVYQNLIEIYKLIFDDVKKSIYQTGIMVIKAKQSNFRVYVLLEDCNTVAIKNKYMFDFEITKYNFDCKSSLQFIKNDIYIDNHSIHFKHRSFYIQILTFKEQVVEITNVLSDYLLLFTCYKNQQYVKLYQIFLEELFLLYTLPTYKYSIKFPFQYRIQKSILMIKALSPNQSNYILIYDIQLTAVESLIQITEIDQEERFPFDFISLNEYFYQFQEQLQIQTLEQPCFYLNTLQESLGFIQDKPLKITTFSMISNQSIDLEFHLCIINKNYTLQQLNLNQRILTGNIINIENIFGNVEAVEIIGSQNIQVNMPLTFNNHSMICDYYRFSICVNRSYIIRNIFDLNTSISYSQDIDSTTIQYIGFNPDDCNHAIYTKQMNTLIVNQFNFCHQNQKLLQNYKVLNNADQYTNFKQINDFQIARSALGVLFFTFQNKLFVDKTIFNAFEQIHFDLFDSVKIENFIYLTINLQQQQFELRLINFTLIGDNVQSDIILYSNYDLNSLFANLLIEFASVNLKQIQIYYVNKNNNQVDIRFIAILEYHLAFLMKITLDSNNLNQIKFEQQGMIRYEQDALFNKSLFIDNNHVLLAFKIECNTFINVFDISILSKTKNIDSIQKFRDNNYTNIEKYNKTHFVLVEKINKSSHQVHLIMIDKLRLECQGQCSNTAYLKLSNKVSEIEIEINFQTEKEINVVSLQLIIVITNFISIWFKLFCKQSRKC